MVFHKRKILFQRKKITPRLIRNLLIVIFFLTIAAVIFTLALSPIKTPQEMANRIQEFGVLGPLLVIFLIIIETIVTPLPGVLIAIASGFAFGTLRGSIYTYTGSLIGCLLAFYLAKHFGRPLIEELFSKKTIDKYDTFFTQKGRPFLWIAYAIPVFPGDVLAYLAGFSGLHWKKFAVIVAIMTLPGVLFLNFFGATITVLSVKQIVFIAIFSYTLLFGFGFLLYKRLQAQIR